ncbi:MULTISPECIES: 3-hydroxyacyl-CoA dehydrogenase NAD-binding domain-containing protein [Bradyrhizobium]|jgi:3-hydroxyacyl-CoA dehydrogenase / enoyl-CoA hydratase / 3-hydroxybutyryl-CoA epimerase|uniref:3-hydroxyacyl-CoA dehydrogenase NAD-binding domain-containing protein n=1 Tax=Bradyrhizobium TaxID=374 RepID=UPI0004833762|nr:MULTISPECIES: 3-hydroxyacyl-CoA dehydrogenase NAD-binding domain-containing protein [Bradyrhizobium]MCS3445744.1 3-hydroxyacyl-CoA dehydrogenase/enoyl-CoA hydratase/3-hydroxybutyryl-CoA epimerase [Bradyrhizobium elkanii]MCS3563125.1 3-hydroxyacyl-CoA dehydrogenase/enoyl-CoA hydratase/3-hydroxybutyryl-CoA epimerase [Bradyrhizobium elkanii]MCW2147040.1 3-hydroxyacyl-CoA dehydrogenase/enoyl-CoA hydratase/3-hydroxybutyryl-CoA epimerase [Bradyrhizobium elkanii]MCW2353885.1 3-hydroxyacyl-CoA dehyd
MAYKNFKFDVDADGIALVTWDIPNRSMNVFDEISTQEIDEIIKQTTGDAAIKGVVITSAKEAFCAGADLSMLEGMNRSYAQLFKEKGEEAANQMLFEQSRRMSQSFRAIETSGKPWVAAINGLALGGGFEITLACHYRVAAENPKTRLGLPEIKVGLFPGAGGTQRVPRLVQPADAMQLLLKGEAVNLTRAKALNLIHAVVPAADLIKAAKDWIKGGGKAVAPWDEKGFKLPGGPVFSKMGMQMFPAGNAIYRRETYDNYPAARAIMSCVYEGLQLPIDAALRVESRYFTKVLRSKEAAAMIRSLFLSMQELNKGARRPAGVPPTKVKKLAVIGAGFMGASVGYVSAQAGIDVVLVDRDLESADKGKGHAKTVVDGLIAKGRMKQDAADAILARISATADYNVISDCDLVIEAVFEDRKVKADTYAKAQPLLKPGAIFASNTSTLPINSLAEEFKDQGKFIGIHFFSPVEKMMLVEIILGKNTGDVALATALDYVRAIGKTPIVVNDSRGFFANRCVMRYISEGNEMLLEGVPPAMIENTAKMAGMPVGPLSLQDEVALDLGLKITKATEADLGPNAIDQAQKKLMVEMVEKQGRFGRKNGKGFYDYPEKGKGQKSLWPGLANLQPKQLDPDTLSVEELKQRFLVVQAVEAARTVEDHVITDVREADVGSILGFGFAPFTGGALSYIDFMGTKNFVALCHSFEKKYGSRFTPPKLLEEMAAKGETFYGRFPPKKQAA